MQDFDRIRPALKPFLAPIVALRQRSGTVRYEGGFNTVVHVVHTL